jgi:hypothetical protein
MIIMNLNWTNNHFPDPATILATYRAIGREIVFSGEKYCHPDDTEAVRAEYKYVQGRNILRYPFLNAGGFVGTCGELRACLTAYPKWRETQDDQRYWTNVYLSKRFSFGIDHDARLLVCMAGTAADQVLYQGKRAYLQGVPGVSKAHPVCFLHFNGWSVERLDEVHSLLLSAVCYMLPNICCPLSAPCCSLSAV